MMMMMMMMTSSSEQSWQAACFGRQGSGFDAGQPGRQPKIVAGCQASAENHCRQSSNCLLEELSQAERKSTPQHDDDYDDDDDDDVHVHVHSHVHDDVDDDDDDDDGGGSGDFSQSGWISEH